jgi:hypothetical protein
MRKVLAHRPNDNKGRSLGEELRLLLYRPLRADRKTIRHLDGLVAALLAVSLVACGLIDNLSGVSDSKELQQTGPIFSRAASPPAARRFYRCCGQRSDARACVEDLHAIGARSQH